jgi:meiotically up-regulated gene 157 (Mug157) protein
MDDANIPSLLAMTYLGYSSVHDPGGAIMERTRKSLLSTANPLYFEGTVAKGIGMIHSVLQ